MPQPQSDIAALDLQAIAGRARQMLALAEVEGTEFAVKVGVPYSTMRSYLSGKRAPSPEFLVGCYRAFGFMPSWLLTGDGPSIADGTPTFEAGHIARAVGHAISYIAAEPIAAWRTESGRPASIDTLQSRGAKALRAGPLDSSGALLPHIGAKAVRPLVLSLPVGEVGGQNQKIEYQVIPRHMKPASAGSGSGIDQETDRDVVDLAGDVAFSFEWLRRNLADTSGALLSIQVRGDSMATTLLDGETIVIDQGVTAVESDGIYVLEVYGRRLVKRVQHLHDGTLILISDNQAYQRETVARDVARNVMVIGRMVWPRVR